MYMHTYINANTHMYMHTYINANTHTHTAVVCNLIHKFTEQLCLRRRTLEGIAIVRTAIERYSPSPTTLTAIHCDLVQV